VCNRPIRLSQATCGHIIGAVPRQKKFAHVRFPAQKSMQRRNADELRVSTLSQFSSRRENATQQRYFAGNFFARDDAGATNFATQKKFAPDAIMDALKGLTRRKTRESVPSDSLRRHFADRVRRHCTADFGSVSTREARDVFARRRRQQRHTVPLRCRSSS